MSRARHLPRSGRAPSRVAPGPGASLRAVRLDGRLASVVVVAAALCVGLGAACGGQGASYPGRSKVMEAQVAWCEALESYIGEGQPWRQECNSHHPVASAAYLQTMVTCFNAQMLQSRDLDSLIEDCTAAVTVDLPFVDDAGQKVLDARCRYVARCDEDITFESCSAVQKDMLESEKSVFAMSYNPVGQADLVDCIDGASCDEELGSDVCYEELAPKLLWFPED